ncbi:MAG: cobalamin biosynthesis protein [Actinomycetota bacterium]
MPQIALGIAAGSLIDLLVGDPARFHPVAAFGRVACALERIMWRPSRVVGALYTLALVGATGGAAWILSARLGRHSWGLAAFTAVVVWAVLGGRSLAREALRIAEAVDRDDLEEARRRLPVLVGRDPSTLDGDGICRAVVESVAENTSDAVVAPLLWCALAGPAGAVGYRAANTLDAMVGYRSERHERFGWAAARLDDLLNWPAARLSAFLSIALAPCVSGDAGRALRVVRRDGSAHPSPNSGKVEAAFAGAFGVRLGGTNRYGQRVERRPCMGEGETPGVETVRQAVRLSRLVGAAAGLGCSLVAWGLWR